MKLFLRELRRRRVPQVVGLYLAFGWMVVEVSDTTFPRLGLPDWTVTFLLVLIVLGLPVSAVLAWFYDVGPDGVTRTTSTERDTHGGLGDDATRPADGPSVPGARPGRRVVTIGLLAAVVAVALALVLSSPDDAVREEGTVAVFPFRVSGDLGHLREGMVDLLSTKLSGEVGPRALDPRITLRQWREAGGGDDLLADEAAALARRVGASHVLTGEVVSAGGSVTLTASLSASSEVAATPLRASVTGPADSVLQLVDHLAAELLGLGAGLGSDRLTGLTSTSLDAVVDYLLGLQAYRAGQFEEAIGHFGRAVDVDSTFAMAAHYLNAAMGWGYQGEEFQRAGRLAWTYRDRLNRLDRARVEARFGPRGPGSQASPQERLEAIRGALKRVPDDPEVWHEVGDLIFHSGHRRVSPDPVREARQAFTRAADLDPGFSAPVHHLIELAALDRDTAAVRRYYERYTAESGLESSGAVAPGYVAGLALRDSAIVAHFEPRLRQAPSGPVGYTAFSAGLAALPLDGLRRALRARAAAAATTRDRATELWRLPPIEQSAGRTTTLNAVMDELAALEEDVALYSYLQGGVLDGDSADARIRVERALAGTADGSSRLTLELAAAALRIPHGDTAGTRALVLEALRQPVGGEAGHPALVTAWGLELDATLAVLDGAPAAAAKVARVDSFASLASGFRPAILLTTARLWEELGEYQKALAIARRLGLQRSLAPAHWLLRARLAARLGYRDEAVHHYRLYLDARENAEPGTRAFDNLRAASEELGALVAEPS